MTDPASIRSLPLGGIDHVAVAVHDADAAIATYTAVTGHEVIGDELVPAAGVRLVYLRAPSAGPDDTVLQLVQPTTTTAAVAEHLRARGEGLHHLCYRTSSLGQALSTRGTDAKAIFIGGHGLPCAFLAEEPHGVLIELTQRTEEKGH